MWRYTLQFYNWVWPLKSRRGSPCVVSAVPGHKGFVACSHVKILFDTFKPKLV